MVMYLFQGTYKITENEDAVPVLLCHQTRLIKNTVLVFNKLKEIKLPLDSSVEG